VHKPTRWFAKIHSRISAIRARFVAIDRYALSNVAHEIYSSLHRNKQTFLETNMDYLNTFLAFNACATAITLIAFATMRESIASTINNVKSKLSDINVAGLGGAATSLVLLASVAHLFQ
jgi:hypothetical protein